MKGQTRFIVEFLGALGAAGLLALCLFAGESLEGLPNILRSVVMALTAVFRDASTKWMTFVCVCIYFICFLILRQRWGNEFFRPSNLSAWVALLLVIAVGHVVFYYESSARSTQAIVLLGAATLGSGAAVCREWRPEKSGAVMAKVIGIFLMLLAVGALASAESFLDFQYRGKQRETGLWDNPNTSGILMGAGTVLAVSSLVQALRFKVQSWMYRTGNIEHPTSNVQNRKWHVMAWESAKVIFPIVAAGVLSFGLIKSYSRGAWVGAGIGIAFLIWTWTKGKLSGGEASVLASLDMPETKRVAGTLAPPDETIITHLTPALSPHPMGGEGEAVSRGSFVSRFKIVLASVCVILAAVFVLAFWNLRHTEYSTTRRAFSVANVNDFSWRKRVAAYEGALQMIAEKPWFGFGWNTPELAYDKFYRKPKVDEGMAIQMNDYFMLGATLGIPALGCFIAYIWLSLTRNGERGTRKSENNGEHRTSNIEHPTSKGNAEFGTGNGERPTFNTQLSTLNEEWLRMTCRAGAIVLLVGFFFDGGLFKLATGATFWILIELGSASGVQGSKVKVQSLWNAGNATSAVASASL